MNSNHKGIKKKKTAHTTTQEWQNILLNQRRLNTTVSTPIKKGFIMFEFYWCAHSDTEK